MSLNNPAKNIRSWWLQVFAGKKERFQKSPCKCGQRKGKQMCRRVGEGGSPAGSNCPQASFSLQSLIPQEKRGRVGNRGQRAGGEDLILLGPRAPSKEACVSSRASVHRCGVLGPPFELPCLFLVGENSSRGKCRAGLHFSLLPGVAAAVLCLDPSLDFWRKPENTDTLSTHWSQFISKNGLRDWEIHLENAVTLESSQSVKSPC